MVSRTATGRETTPQDHSGWAPGPYVRSTEAPSDTADEATGAGEETGSPGPPAEGTRSATGHPEGHQRCGSCGQPLGSWDIDKLTGVLNRWGWDERAPGTLAHAKGHREPVALLIVDLDSFKQINDMFGHLAGDAVLRSVAAALRDATRGCDLVGRFGGDEFVLLLPATHLDGAAAVARRIRQRLRDIVVPGAGTEGGPARGASATVGIALCSPDRDAGIDLDRMLSDADTALLAAKRRGSDRTCIIRPWMGREADHIDHTRLLFDPPLRDVSGEARTRSGRPRARTRGGDVVRLPTPDPEMRA